MHGSAKIKVDLRKSDALWRFKETVPRISSRNISFHEYKGLKRLPSIIISGEWEWRKKLERQRRVLILPLRTFFPSILLAGFSVGWLPGRPTIYQKRVQHLCKKNRQCFTARAGVEEGWPLLMTREMDVRTETLYILQGGKNIMYYTLPLTGVRQPCVPDDRIHCDERIETLKCKIV